jgi:hypothetical protein
LGTLQAGSPRHRPEAIGTVADSDAEKLALLASLRSPAPERPERSARA